MTREPTKPPKGFTKPEPPPPPPPKTAEYKLYVDVRVLNRSLLQTIIDYLNEKERSTMEFRELNDDEREAFFNLDTQDRQHRLNDTILSHTLSGTNSLRVQYINQPDNPGNRRKLKSLGSFTICCVIDLGDSTKTSLGYAMKWVGVSRRSHKDKPNRVRGNMLAFIRAITSSPVPR